MVARGEAMYGCYGDSYSYRLWSLANVWSTCQFPPLTGAEDKPADAPPALEDDDMTEVSSAVSVAGSVTSRGRGGRGRSSPPMPLGPGGPHICSQCGGAYPTKELLEKHELLHSPNTQSCKICNKSFANVYRLQRHMISHDESALLRKFKCNDCDKAFKFKHHLKEHLRIHSGEKPFECGNCGKKFSHSGSYSSHMTSKKCLVMNLKMGRIRPNNPALNPDRSPSRKRSSLALQQLNNNSSQNNNNSFMPILPKYEAAAAAAFLASIAPRDGPFPPPSGALGPAGLHSLYHHPGLPMHPPGAITPYSLPSSLSHLLEQIASSQYLPRKIDSDNMIPKDSRSSHSDAEDLIEEVYDEDDKRSSIDGERELVMDIEDEEPDKVKVKDEKPEEESDRPNSVPPQYPNSVSPNVNHTNGNIGLNMILESVNASVTKHLLEANMHKLSPHPKVPSPIPPVEIKRESPEILECSRCSTRFNHKAELLQHEQVLCGQLFRKHEGLGAQVAETLALNRIESELHVSANSGLSGSEDEEYCKDTDGNAPSEGERKVRVRTAISDEQQTKLKEHYSRNQRPNREEFKLIAQQLGLDNRVVQVWFQNNRARVRRMNQTLSFSEQPLDLSTKKTVPSVTSSPSVSPSCNTSFAHYDSGVEVVNLSQKSSRSPTPYRNPFSTNYQHSNCSSSSLADYRHSPSPCDNPQNGIKRLHSSYKMLPSPSVGYNISDKLASYSPDGVGLHSPLSTHHLISDMGRTSSSSPGSDKRSWTEESRGYHEIDGEEVPSKKPRLKNFTDSSKEPEGQFVCDQCDKTFVKQSSLARHKYEHSGQRPYKCLECPKAFKHKHHLTEHKRLHTGEKPFQCNKCLKKFSHSGSFSQHMNHRYSYCKPYRE